MWLSKPITGLSLAVAVSGCGFEPVYAPSGATAALMPRISVNTPDNTRNSYQLVQHIEDRIGQNQGGDLALATSVSVTETGTGTTKDGQTTRYMLRATATYTLTDTSTATTITNGSVQNFTAYSATGDTASTQASQRDAYKRLMVIMADSIVERLMMVQSDSGT